VRGRGRDAVLRPGKGGRGRVRKKKSKKGNSQLKKPERASQGGSSDRKEERNLERKEKNPGESHGGGQKSTTKMEEWENRPKGRLSKEEGINALSSIGRKRSRGGGGREVKEGKRGENLQKEEGPTSTDKKEIGLNLGDRG